MNTNDNQLSTADDGSSRAEARQLLSATITRLRDSRCRLETQPAAPDGSDDAAIYIATAEMHLKAALFRLEDDTSGRPSFF